MDEFFSGPRGEYNTRFVRSVFTSKIGDKYTVYAEMENGATVELYDSPEEQAIVIPGHGVCREVWEYDGEVGWTETTIIGWRVSKDRGDPHHEPICINQPNKSADYFVKDASARWTAPGDCSFDTWKKAFAYATENIMRMKDRKQTHAPAASEAAP